MVRGHHDYMQPYMTLFPFSLLGVAIVNFAVIYQTASSSDVIVYPPGGAITFQDGQNVSLITLVVLDDGVPELDQTLVVTLVSLSGNGPVGVVMGLWVWLCACGCGYGHVGVVMGMWAWLWACGRGYGC